MLFRSKTGETLEQRMRHREDKADAWGQWFRQRMDANAQSAPIAHSTQLHAIAAYASVIFSVHA